MLKRFGNVEYIEVDDPKILQAAVPIATSNRYSSDLHYWIKVMSGEDVNTVPGTESTVARYFGKPDEFLARLRKWHHYVPFEFGKEAVMVEGSRWLAMFMWYHVNRFRDVILGGLEMSLRRTTASDYVHVNNEIDAFYQKAGTLYKEAIKSGVPYQEARRILPLNTKTYVVFAYVPRSLNKLKNAVEKSAQNFESKEFSRTAKNLESLLDMDLDEYPSEILTLNNDFSTRNFRKSLVEEHKLENDFGTYYSFTVPMSVLSFHQMIRERLIKLDVNIADSVHDKRIILAPELDALREDYLELFDLAAGMQDKFWDNKDYVYALVLGQVLYPTIHMDDHGARKLFRTRLCKGAVQPEIYTISSFLHDHLGLDIKQYGPSCITEGVCREPNWVFDTCITRTRSYFEKWANEIKTALSSNAHWKYPLEK